jgi:hypothetical protein
MKFDVHCVVPEHTDHWHIRAIYVNVHSKHSIALKRHDHSEREDYTLKGAKPKVTQR